MMRSIHPAADLFPMMRDDEYRALVADIGEHGLREPIILFDGAILDGRHRYRACMELSVAPVFEMWEGDGSPEAFVVSKNLHRRHLSESQRAMIAGRLATRKREDSLYPGGARPVEDQIQPSTTLRDAAELLNVSRSSVIEAKKVMTEGTPEEIAAVESGEAAVSTIAKQIRAGTPKEKRRKKEPLAQTGRNPERIQRQRLNAEIWGRVRDALTHLTNLPLPADVVSIVRAHDKAGLVDAKLSTAINWIGEFDNEWRNRDQNAA